MRALAVIPARAGSRRLPGKNLAELGGRPLVVYTLEAVVASRLFDRIVLTSDDPRVLDIGTRYPGVEPSERPPALAEDDTTNGEVVLELLERPGSRAADTDVIGLFQPTSPLRSVEDIQAGFAVLARGFDAAVSVARCRPLEQSAFEIDAASGEARIPPGSRLLATRRAPEPPPRYLPNGALYLVRAQALLATRSFFAGRVGCVIMPAERSVDIDEALDLEWARFLLARSSSS